MLASISNSYRIQKTEQWTFHGLFQDSNFKEPFMDTSLTRLDVNIILCMTMHVNIQLFTANQWINFLFVVLFQELKMLSILTSLQLLMHIFTE